MTAPLPIRCLWNGEAFVPQGKSLAYCQEEFGAGEIVILERNEERTTNTHNHFFASIHEAWMNLPENLADEYPTVEHLRAKALIHTGFSNERAIVCDTAKDAATIAEFIGQSNQYAIVRVSGNVLKVYTAKSQSRKSMNKKEFQASKEAVLGFVAGLVGVSQEQLKENA